MQKLIAGLTSALLIATSATAGSVPPENQAAVDEIIATYQSQCNAEQANYVKIDDEAKQPLPGVLRLADDAIYQLPIATSGKMATVLYPAFNCSNVGYAWCGTGGCGFYIIVDGVTYERPMTFRPQSVTIPTPIGKQVVIIFAKQGYFCESASGEPTYGPDSCYDIATWDERRKTFMTTNGALSEWYPNMP